MGRFHLSFLSRISLLMIIFIRWSGSAEQEHAIDKKTGKTVVRIDPRYFRPAEVEYVDFNWNLWIPFMIFHFPLLASCSVILAKPRKFLDGNAKSPLMTWSKRWLPPISKRLAISSKIKIELISSLSFFLFISCGLRLEALTCINLKTWSYHIVGWDFHFRFYVILLGTSSPVVLCVTCLCSSRWTCVSIKSLVGASSRGLVSVRPQVDIQKLVTSRIRANQPGLT